MRPELIAPAFFYKEVSEAMFASSTLGNESELSQALTIAPKLLLGASVISSPPRFGAFGGSFDADLSA